MAITSTFKTAENIRTEGNINIDIADQMFLVGDPSEAPMVATMGGSRYEGEKKIDIPGKIKSEECLNNNYRVIERDVRSRSAILQATIPTRPAVGGTATYTMTSTASLRVADIVVDKTTQTKFYVVSITNSTTAVLRVLQVGSGANEAASEEIVMCGSAYCESGDKASVVSQMAEPRDRWLQIFKTSFSMSNTARAVATATKGSAFDTETEQAMADHRRDLNYSFFMNPNVNSTTDNLSRIVNISQGFIAEATNASRTYSPTSFTADIFFGLMSEKAFEYGPQRKQLAVNSAFKTFINKDARAKLQITKTYENKYGISIMEVESGHGIYEIYTDGTLNKFFPADTKLRAAVLDFSMIRYKYLKGRNTQIEKDVHTPGIDGKQDQILCEAGWSVRCLKHHLWIEASL